MAEIPRTSQITLEAMEDMPGVARTSQITLEVMSSNYQFLSGTINCGLSVDAIITNYKYLSGTINCELSTECQLIFDASQSGMITGY